MGGRAIATTCGHKLREKTPLGNNNDDVYYPRGRSNIFKRLKSILRQTLFSFVARTGPRSPTGLLQTRQQTHQALSGKMLLPETALDEPRLAGGLLDRETQPTAILARDLGGVCPLTHCVRESVAQTSVASRFVGELIGWLCVVRCFIEATFKHR